MKQYESNQMLLVCVAAKDQRNLVVSILLIQTARFGWPMSSVRVTNCSSVIAHTANGASTTAGIRTTCT